MDEREFRKGRPCTVVIHGTLKRDGFDGDGDVSINGHIISDDRSAEEWFHCDPKCVTLEPEPIKVGDIVRGYSVATGEAVVGEVRLCGNADLYLAPCEDVPEATCIRASTAKLVCLKEDRKDLPTEEKE